MAVMKGVNCCIFYRPPLSDIHVCIRKEELFAMVDHSPEPHAHPSNEHPPDTKPINFSTLANGQRELTIEHEGQFYRLRVTKNGKLLLNK